MRTCWNNEENVPKYTIEQGISSPDMSPGGEDPLTRQIRALSRGEKGPKLKANVLQIGPNFVGVAQNTIKIGPRRHLQGATAPLVRPHPYGGNSGPPLVGYLPPPCQCRCQGVGQVQCI